VIIVQFYSASTGASPGCIFSKTWAGYVPYKSYDCLISSSPMASSLVVPAAGVSFTGRSYNYAPDAA